MTDERVVQIPIEPRPVPPEPLGGGSGGTMDTRLTRLEEWAKLSEERAKRMEDKLDDLLQLVAAQPSRIDYFVGLGVVFAIVALIFAGMAWLDGRQANRMTQQAPPPQPIVIQVPQPEPANTKGR
jgi:hypothetical protein